MGNEQSSGAQISRQSVLVSKEETDITVKKTGVVLDTKNIPNFKVVLIGDPGVGKSSIFTRYVSNKFQYEYKPTRKFVIENVVKNVNVPSKAVCCVTLWDLPGSEDMDLRTSYYRNVDAAIVVVDMNDVDSIELAGAWKQDFLNKTTKCKLINEKNSSGVKVTKLEHLPCDPSKIPVLLVGNKYDIVEERLRAERLRKTLQENLLENETEEDVVERNFDEMETQLGVKDKKKKKKKAKKEAVEGERLFPVQRGPKDTDTVPECVKILEEVEKDHSFIGSVMVSARDGDGSADESITSLLRYLLEQHYGWSRQKIQKEEETITVENKEKEYRPLVETGQEEIDKLFKKCYKPLRRCGDYYTYHELTIKRFKQQCADSGFLDHGKPSLEDCILGIREVLKVVGKMSLKSEDFENFLTLNYKTDPRVKVPDVVDATLKVFNTEYAVVCNSVVRDCTILDKVLEKYDKKIMEKCDRIKELMPLDGEEAVVRVVRICEQNRARIAFARSQAQECVKDVKNAKLKVKASLMW